MFPCNRIQFFFKSNDVGGCCQFLSARRAQSTSRVRCIGTGTPKKTLRVDLTKGGGYLVVAEGTRKVRRRCNGIELQTISEGKILNRGTISENGHRWRQLALRPRRKTPLSPSMSLSCPNPPPHGASPS